MSRPVVEIVAIGTELLLGDTIDTNSAWLGAQLAAAGMPVARRSSVVDDFALMTATLREALARADVVICTGGLGPTHDDFTREVAAALLGRPLEPDDQWLHTLHERYATRGIAMPVSNYRQAMVPRGGIVLPNPRGSAPGLWIEHDGRILVLLPGVPVELHSLGELELLPRLRARYPDAHPVGTVRLRTTGVPESRLAESVADLIADIAPLDVAFLPSLAGVDIRITANDLPPAAASVALAQAEARFSERIGVAHFGGHGVVHAAVVGARLLERGWHVAFAESCTGG
ncbi:MAG: molybdopterin-binding protein, partial [Longimicrobiales bacterium]